MDAASNNSVEDIRGIKEKVNFLPTLAKYRVYIIDEVHMLSTGAFNALLKTLEEPPEHVKFILATTEPQKLLATILSRCQRFDFKKISNEDIIKRLKIVCEQSGIQITDGALKLIANLSEGAARDALSILERCIQDGNSNIDEDKIKDLVGIPKFTYVNNIIKAIIDKDIESSIKAIDEVLNDGKDLENFLWEMIKQVKDMLIYKVNKKNDIYNEEEINKIDEICNKVPKEELINIIYRLSELENKMKMSSQKIIIFETEIIKLCIKTDTLALETRIEKLEKAISSGNIQVNMQNVRTKNEVKLVEEKLVINKEEIQKEDIKEKLEEVKKKPKQEVFSVNKINGWDDALNNIKAQGKVMLYANLINTEIVEINDMTVAIRFNNGLNSFRRDLLEKPENMEVLKKQISIICGRPIQIKLEDCGGQVKGAKIQKTSPAQKQESPRKEKEEDILSSLDIPINFIEEE